MAKPEKEIQFDFTKTEKELETIKNNVPKTKSEVENINPLLIKDKKNDFWNTDLEDVKKYIKNYELELNLEVKNKKSKKNTKTANIYGYFTAIVGLLGLMFSINYAGWLIFAGLFYKNKKDPEVFFWLALGLIGTMFAIPYSGWLIFYGILKNL